MSDSGRYYVIDLLTNRSFCVEPIDDKNRSKWGDVNPSTGEIEGNYGQKHKGCIQEKESIIQEKNGFKNISNLESGESPDSKIQDLLNEKKSEPN